MLPTEVIDIIIDFLHDDFGALNCCALVSSTWTLSCRFHLFQSLTLNHTNGRPDEELRHAIRCFTSPLGRLCGPFVRQLAIWPFYRMNEQVDSHVFLSLLHSLPRLQSLALGFAVLSDISLDGSIPLASSSVQTVTMWKPRWRGVTPLELINRQLDILQLLPGVKRLHYVERDWMPSLTSEDFFQPCEGDALSRRLKIEVLVLHDNTPVSLFIEHSCKRMDLSILTSLSIWRPDQDDIPSIGILIHLAKEHLEHVALCLEDVELFEDGQGRTSGLISMGLIYSLMLRSGTATPETLCPQLHLKECTKLRTLHLSIPAAGDSLQWTYGQTHPWSIANAILEQLPSSVHEIRLAIESDGVADMLYALRFTNWGKQAQAYGRLPDLQSVVFSTWDPEFVPEDGDHCTKVHQKVQKLITDHLPDLHSRGILRFN